MKKIEETIELGGRTLTLKTGILAEQASGAVLATYGDTVVLATVVASPLKVELDYFPLSIEYQERLYAGGRIKGSRWVKREGKPTDEEILAGRLIDRSIRPLFSKEYKKDVQVIITVLSVDIENDPKILATIATSAAIAISPIPWEGPSVTVSVGMKDGTFFTNPIDSEMIFSEMDLVVSSTRDAIVMIEAGAKEVSEDNVLKGIEYAKKENDKLIDFIEDFAKKSGVQKEELKKEGTEKELKLKVQKLLKSKLNEVIKGRTTHEGGEDEIKKAIIDELSEENPQDISAIFEKIVKDEIRRLILSGKRADGRTHDQIRPLSSSTSILPRTHGSAIFQRGQTQVLTVTTLGTPSMEQLLESAEGEVSKRYIHHYSMPPYATGETGRVGSPNRREIGHGALAERALEPVIPSEDIFPYTIRIVSEVMSSNGSTSMASVCGSTLSLMDAGVPLKEPVSGIAMGLVIEDDKKFAVLSDISGLEDFNGDMDFKVAGTKKGITALQLDVKTINLTTKILSQALEQAKAGRGKILESMLKTLSAPRGNISKFAPKIKVVKIPVEKIGEIIGPGGKMIKKIMADSGAQIDVEDDGTVNVTGTIEESVSKAASMIEALVKEVVAGEIYDGLVKRIQTFGAFVEILPGKEGLVHVSDMSENFVNDPSDIVKIGDKVQVRVKGIDDFGRINLSMMLDPSFDEKKEERKKDYRRDDRTKHGDNNMGRKDRKSGGPHFPTSRFIGDSNKRFRR